jgi:hypothetical protein
MATTYPVQPQSAGAATAAVNPVSWGAIFAGSAVAVALMILFTTLGVGIGASALDPQYDQNPGSGLGFGSGLYLIVTQLIALAAGGYVAARLAGIPRPVISTLHGTAVWAIATIFLAWAAVMGGGAMFGAASTIVGTSASAASSMGKVVIPDNFSLPNPSQLADAISIDALPEELQTTLREKGITDSNIQQEAKAAFRDVFSQQEQDAAMAQARQTLGDMLQTPGDIGADLSAFFDRLMGGDNAIVSEEDRQEAVTVLERRLNIAPEEAQGIVQSVEDGVQQSVDQAKAAVEAARAQAVETAQAASDAIGTAALLLSLASLLGLAAACGGAFGGKPNSMIGDRIDDLA